MVIWIWLSENPLIAGVVVAAFLLGVIVGRASRRTRRSTAETPWKRSIYNPKDFRRMR